MVKNHGPLTIECFGWGPNLPKELLYMKRSTSLLAIATFSTVGLSVAANAVTIHGLTTRDQLITFDSAMPHMVTEARFITGLAANESLVGMDYRPATGMLYGLGSMGNLYTLNTITATATFVASLFNSTTMMPLMLSGSEFGVDFNPVPDRLRVVSNTGQNLRINVATGATIVDGMLNQANGNPFIVASAYTNSVAGATSTTLYNIDSASDMLTIQSPPNNGTQMMVGSLGMDVTALAGMDILTVGTANQAFAALQTAGMPGSKLAMINLMTGQATVVGNISMNQSSDSLAVRDIAIMPVPEPATMTAVAVGMAFLTRRRKSAK